jgi:hypothetical protein
MKNLGFILASAFVLFNVAANAQEPVRSKPVSPAKKEISAPQPKPAQPAAAAQPAQPATPAQPAHVTEPAASAQPATPAKPIMVPKAKAIIKKNMAKKAEVNSTPQEKK